jgi:hypothetical protein
MRGSRYASDEAWLDAINELESRWSGKVDKILERHNILSLPLRFLNAVDDGLGAAAEFFRNEGDAFSQRDQEHKNRQDVDAALADIERLAQTMTEENERDYRELVSTEQFKRAMVKLQGTEKWQRWTFWTDDHEENARLVNTTGRKLLLGEIEAESLIELE